MMQIASTILFVDDEKHETKYFKKALASVFTIDTAESVDVAIQILNEKHHEIAVVITDQRMPKKMGLELLEFTQTHYPKMVRMLTTAFCDFDSAVNAINKAEVFRYIPKPWDLDYLEDALHQAIKRFHSLQETSGTALKNTLLKDLKDDCQHWLMYALHAYGDVDVYRSGIEALACRYHILINNNFDEAEASDVLEEVDTLLSEDFLNDTLLNNLEAQQEQGFGIRHPTLKTH